MGAVFSRWNSEALVEVEACRVSRLDSAKKGLLPATTKIPARVKSLVYPDAATPA